MKQVDISKSLAIDGWMDKSDLFWLATQAKKYSRIIELGSYCGRSTRALADNTPGFVYAVDNFLGPKDIPFYQGQCVPPPKGEEPYVPQKDLYNQFCKNTEDLLNSHKLFVAKIDHSQLGEKSFPFTPDMIFIDGSHDYKSVCRDIQWALSVIDIRKPSLICGHDADRKEIRSAAIQLLEEIYWSRGSDCNIWWKEFPVSISWGCQRSQKSHVKYIGSPECA